MVLLGRRPDLAYRLRINPDPARKLPKDGWSVFGFRGSVGEFNESPHLLLYVGDKDVCARVILPNKARGGLWTRLRSRSLADPMSRVSREMAPAMASCPGMVPGLILKQRHWRTRGGPSFQDAYLEVDLRTLSGDSESGVKKQREWIEAAPARRRQQGFESRTAGRCDLPLRSLPGDSDPGRSRPRGVGLDRLSPLRRVAPDSVMPMEGVTCPSSPFDTGIRPVHLRAMTWDAPLFRPPAPAIPPAQRGSRSLSKKYGSVSRRFWATENGAARARDATVSFAFAVTKRSCAGSGPSGG